MNENFEAYTRSQAFALTLSGPMIERLLDERAQGEAESDFQDLFSRFPWVVRRTLKFPHWGSTGEGSWRVMPGATVQALIRRGLMEAVPYTNGEDDIERIEYMLTKAGKITSALLVEAGFKADPEVAKLYRPRVGLHPDDRPAIRMEIGKTWTEHRHDRRLDLMTPGDEVYFWPGLLSTHADR